jgi:2-C-methyl-D-erythritol 4-phosphate cytidylyltransferase
MARPDVVSVVCVLPREYAADPPPWIFQCDIDRLMLAPGGRTRTESVRNGLEDLPDEASIVLVHDAARPLVDDATINRVVDTVRHGQSAIAALPVVDTLKQVDAEGRIVRTIERDGLWRAQTPQGFPRAMLVDAHRRARAERIEATDDAALCERAGHVVRVVRGSERALKITDASDFARVEALYGVTE